VVVLAVDASVSCPGGEDVVRGGGIGIAEADFVEWIGQE